MIHKIFSTTLVVALLATSISFNAKADKEEVGAILGGIIGGALGNKIGKGNGKAVATGLGIILGAVVGADVGRTLDEADRRALEDCQRDILVAPIGERREWDGNRYGSRTGNRGHFRTTREGYLRSNSREVCREYESVIVTRNKTETKTGVACSRADGSWREVTTTEVVFRDVQSRRPEPPMVRPLPPPHAPDYRPRPAPRRTSGSLRGYCPDHNHQQFYAAKNFAFSGLGLDLSTTGATDWALEYNRNHRCGTIPEYSARFSALYNMAFSGAGLNLTSADARDYALERIERLSVSDVHEMQSELTAVKNFSYAGNGLNLTKARAGQIAKEWVDRGHCGNANQVQQMWNVYTKEYNFAFSGSGLNMSSARAREYGINKISRMTSCSDLLRL